MNIFKAISDYQKVQFSTFDVGNNYIGSVNDLGSLNQVYWSTVLPGDRWRMGHNVMVKLPPLVSPAFTRIKGIINSFYVKYSSVWKYWNSFISDRPEDVFLSRSSSTAYRGKFVEPRIPMPWIALICKVAKGWARVSTPIVTPSTRNLHIEMYDATSSYDFSVVPFAIAWQNFANNGFRSFAYTDNRTALGSGIQNDSVTPSSSAVLVFDVDSFATIFTTYSNLLGATAYDYCMRLGFLTLADLFVYCCQQCCRQLENFGVPTDLIARSSVSTYNADFFNAMPLLCVSSIWHNFYRSEQNQAPEFDFREINGSINDLANWTLSDGSSPYSGSSVTGNTAPYGWWLKLIGIPPSRSSQSDYWFKVTSFEETFGVLTGFMLDVVVLAQKTALYTNSIDNVNTLPCMYNGLLFLKYRNFEDDYFTSASVDPNLGGVSVQTPGTIDALRTASKYEEFLERGIAKDFVTWLQMQYGEKPSDNYQLPLLLGTQIIPVQIGEQLQTSQTTTGVTGSPLGERAGVADAYSNSGTVNAKFNEHGCIMSLLSFVIDSQYKDGMPHDLFTHKQLDYPFPAFANLGAESISTKELYYGDSFNFHNLADNTGNPVVISKSTGYAYNADVVSPDDSVVVQQPLNAHTFQPGLDISGGNGSFGLSSFGVNDIARTNFNANQLIFGYTPRYSKWKFKMDVVAGQMRDSLDYWHTFREMFQRPFIGHNFISYINAGFINNINRIFATINDNADKFYVDVFNNASVRRCLPLVPDTTLD